MYTYDVHCSLHSSTHLTIVTAGPALPPLSSLPTTRHLSGTPVSPSPAPGTPLRIDTHHEEREGGKGIRCGAKKTDNDTNDKYLMIDIYCSTYHYICGCVVSLITSLNRLQKRSHTNSKY